MLSEDEGEPFKAEDVRGLYKYKKHKINNSNIVIITVFILLFPFLLYKLDFNEVEFISVQFI